MLEIPRSGGTQVVDGTIISDGYTDGDLSQIDLQRMQSFMHSESTDFYGLFSELVERVEKPPVEIKNLSTVELDEVEAPIKTIGYSQVVSDEVQPESTTTTAHAYDETKPKIKRNKK